MTDGNCTEIRETGCKTEQTYGTHHFLTSVYFPSLLALNFDVFRGVTYTQREFIISATMK